MKKFFTFSGTISGKTFLLRTLFIIVMCIPLIIVSNQGVLNVSSTKMRLDCLSGEMNNNILYAENYLEAAGLITALRHGINIKSLRRPINCLKELNDE